MQFVLLGVLGADGVSLGGRWCVWQQADRDATIVEMRHEIQVLRDQNDALEQYGRRNCLRASGISDTEEDTTAAVIKLANDVLKIDPPLEEHHINVSHRLPKPHNAPATLPHPIIIRFNRKTDRDRVIKERKELKEYNENAAVKIYINEDLTSTRARLFSIVRSQQEKNNLAQAWTYNGNIKIKTITGVIKSIKSMSDLKACLPDVNLES